MCIRDRTVRPRSCRRCGPPRGVRAAYVSALLLRRSYDGFRSQRGDFTAKARSIADGCFGVGCAAVHEMCELGRTGRHDREPSRVIRLAMNRETRVHRKLPARVEHDLPVRMFRDPHRDLLRMLLVELGDGMTQ